MLLEARADPNVLMVEDITPLHLAAAAGWIPGIGLLVSFGADLDAGDTFTHETPLHKSARNRQVRAIEKLCGLGANREAKNCDGQSYADILECATEDPKEWAVHNSRASYFRQQNDSARLTSYSYTSKVTVGSTFMENKWKSMDTTVRLTKVSSTSVGVLGR